MITPPEAALILAKVSAFDQRTVGKADAIAWAEVLNVADPPITLEDALMAVTAWHATATEGRMRPAHVIQGAQQIAYRRAGAARAAELAAQQALPAAPEPPLTPERRAELLAKIPPGTPNVLRRKEWVHWERQHTRGDSGPNPLFAGFPPLGGHPEPDEAEDAA